jgi:hypothetical protein
VATGTRRATSPGGNTVRTLDSPTPTFSPRAVDLMPRPAPRMRPIPAFAESSGAPTRRGVTERVP